MKYIILVLMIFLSINIYSQNQGKYYINQISGHEYDVDPDLNLETTNKLFNNLNYVDIGTDAIKIYCNGYVSYLFSRYKSTLIQDNTSTGVKTYKMFSYLDDSYKKVKIKFFKGNKISIGVERSSNYYEIFTCGKANY